MKRIALIAAALFVTLAGAAAGAVLYFKPAFIFSEAKTEEPPAASHGIPNYRTDANAKAETRRTALRLVEQLGTVQDRIIRGDRTALTEQARLLQDIANEIRQFGEEDWNDYVNVRTSMLYVLSGGDAHVLRHLTKREDLSEADRGLAKGIMSFAEGKSKKARELFEDIDPRSLDVSLVGPFALARASLYLEDDHAKSIDLLDDARLACPHTAIDEAAARREIPILLSDGNTPRALMLTTSYVREFGRSIYAWKLFRDFSEAVARRAELDSAETVGRITGALDHKDMQPASELLVDIAGEALLQGRLKLAKAAADRVLQIEDASPENRDKARLYIAAAEAPSSDAGNALKALNQITVDRLSEDDKEIREVSGFIANAVVGGAPVASRPTVSGSERAQPAAVAQEASAMRATSALSQADALLKQADSMISRSER